MRQAGVTEAPARARRDRAYVDFGVDESWAPAPAQSRRRRADSWIEESELFASHYDADPLPAAGLSDHGFAEPVQDAYAEPVEVDSFQAGANDWDGVPDDAWGGFDPSRSSRRAAHEARPTGPARQARASRPTRDSRPAAEPRPARNSRPAAEPRPARGTRPSRRAGGRSDSGYAHLASIRPGATVLVGDDAVPVSIDVLAHPAHVPAAPAAAPREPAVTTEASNAPRVAGSGVPGRRTVTIRGRGAERDLAFPAPGRARRPPVRRHERPGFKPDRTALWALLLGVVLVLVAATSSHAATLRQAATGSHARPAARVTHAAPRRAPAAALVVRAR